ncbi:MAG: hypothetical protein R2706_10970 [Acidimicrobiales bacterium]
MDIAPPQRHESHPANPPALHTIDVGDRPAAWAAAGFALSGPSADEVMLGQSG